MKKTYYIKNLDCANCALKIENEIKKLDGVSKAKVDYANEIILIESHKHYSSSDLDKLAKKIEDQVSIHDEEIHEHEMNKSPEIIINILGVIFLMLAYILNELHVLSDIYILLLYITAYIGIGGKVLLKAIKNIYRGQFFDEHFLMSIATLGAFFIGEYIEGVAVMLFYRIGEILQDLAVSNSKKSIKALLDIKPEVAHLEKENQIVNVKPEELEKDQIIIIYPGEKIPVDGVVIEGTSAVDESKLTGESLPKDISKGVHILSGSINISGMIKASVLETYEHSTVSKIIAFAKDNIDKKATTEKFITRFAKLYTPIVVLLAVFLAFAVPLLDSLWFSEETYRFLMPIYVERALIFLVISCPCALVLSIPLSFFSGIGAQSKQGVLVKSGSDIETLAELKNVVFDKTGTLTKGTFEIVDIVSKDKDLLMKYAAHAESFSTHPIAKSIVSSYPYPINQSLVTQVSEVFGQGVSCLFENHKLLVGSAKLMEQNHIALPVIQQGKTIVYVAYDNQLTGYLTISDVLKENSKKTIEELRKQMIDVSVVTGDHMQSANHILNGLHIKTYANCLPEDKVSIVESYIQKGKTAFIGDGVNDAPVLISANLGVAMGGLGSDAAIEAADAVIMNDDPYKIIDAIRISKKTMRIVKQNIVFAIGIKVIVLILGALGLANMWLAIFADVGVSLLAVFNSLRIFKSNK